jgi:CBS domain containing-hemolysin-like protein
MTGAELAPSLSGVLPHRLPSPVCDDMPSFAPYDWIFVIAVAALLLLSASFSAAEIGILSINRFRLHQLAEEGSSRARLLQRLLQQPASFLTTILIAITAVNYTNESLVTYWLVEIHHFPEWVPFFGLLLLVLIFAEITPINYAAANPEFIAVRAAPWVALASKILRPLVATITALASALARIFCVRPRTKPLVTGEEVLTIVDMETERGVLEEEEKELIHSIFDFSDTIVREVMVPRIDIAAVSNTTPMSEAIDEIVQQHYSRMPVYQGNLDHIIGIVYAKDLLPYQFHRNTDRPVSEAIRPASFVPETKRVTELLQEFRESQQAMAIVLDEYGGTAGLVTVEDLLEEIVGEIYDEYDIGERPFERLDDRTILVSGKFAFAELHDVFDHEFPEGEYDTVGGLLYSRFGEVPARGEAVIIDGYTFTVDQVDGHRITQVRIVSPESTPAIDEEDTAE